MNPTYIIAGVIAFALLAVNTPSLTTWIGSLFKSRQPSSNGQCVRTQYPLNVPDVRGRRHEFTICPETAARLLEDLTIQLDRVSK